MTGQRMSPAAATEAHAELQSRVAEAFGQTLRKARRQKQMKQETLAFGLGVSRTTVSNIECGRQRVSLFQVYLAASVLEVRAADLLPDLLVPTSRLHFASDEPISELATRRLAEDINEAVARL